MQKERKGEGSDSPKYVPEYLVLSGVHGAWEPLASLWFKLCIGPVFILIGEFVQSKVNTTLTPP